MTSNTNAAPTDSDALVKDYERFTKRKLWFIVLFVIIAIIALGISLYIGPRTNITFFETYEIIYNHIIGTVYAPGTSAWMDDYVIWNIRLPRTLFALIAGAALAVAGVAMQTVMNNPLADPYTTGISSGACFGVAIAMVLGLTITFGGGGLDVVITTFLFALVPVLLIILLSPKTKSSPTTLILAGVAISYLFNSFTTLLLVSTDSETLAAVYTWQVGSVENITWNQIPLTFIISVIGIVVIMALSKMLNVLSLGDASAKSLGLDVDTIRLVCLFVMAFMVAVVVSYAGIIGFIGLVSPHIVRMLIGADNRYIIPAAAAFCASFFLLADIACRILSPVGAIPVGVILSFVGAPIFLYLIVRRNSRVW